MGGLRIYLLYSVDFTVQYGAWEFTVQWYPFFVQYCTGGRGAFQQPGSACTKISAGKGRGPMRPMRPMRPMGGESDASLAFDMPPASPSLSLCDPILTSNNATQHNTAYILHSEHRSDHLHHLCFRYVHFSALKKPPIPLPLSSSLQRHPSLQLRLRIFQLNKHFPHRSSPSPISHQHPHRLA